MPGGPPPSTGWPAVYILDTPQYRRALAALRRLGELPGAVVGIGYAGEDAREQDYTPGDGPGRADQFVDFLHNDVLSAVQAQAGVPLDPRRRTLCGHSLGALLGMYALYRESPAFSGYVLSSPSVWWADRPAHRWAQEVAARARWQGATQVWLSVGEHEQGLSPQEQHQPAAYRAAQAARRGARQMVDGARELAEVLSRQPGLALHFRLLAGCSHGDASEQSLAAGWRTILGL